MVTSFNTSLSDGTNGDSFGTATGPRAGERKQEGAARLALVGRTGAEVSPRLCWCLGPSCGALASSSFRVRISSCLEQRSSAPFEFQSGFLF